MEALRQLHRTLTGYPAIYFRVVLFFTFTGHGFVSLGFSPGYQLHYQIFESVNFLHLDIPSVLQVVGIWDLFVAVMILSGFGLKYILSASLVYLVTVAGFAWAFFVKKTGSAFGFAESFRRFAWIFYVIFLWFHYVKDKRHYPLLRYGIAFAFLAHGLASLGYFGLKGAHVELASQVLTEDMANKVVLFSGYSDTTIGLLVMTGILSRPAIAFGSLWLIVVVYLSFLLAFPDGLFRTGFFLSAVYVAMDGRCHERWLWQQLKARGAEGYKKNEGGT